MDSIGITLKSEREKRGLSVQEAHDATKIAIQSIAALEEDRFESFPNKVYARAFLRDYANFLGLDSTSLLAAYEEAWSPKADIDTTPKKNSGSAWRAIGYSLLVVVLVAGLAASGYYGLYTLQHKRAADRTSVSASNHSTKPDVATIPKAQPVAPPKSDVATEPKPAPAAVEQAKPIPATPSLEVTALRDVWVQIKADNKTVFMNIIPKGATKTFEGQKSIYIKTGMAGAVQLKFNGQIQPPLGSLKVRGEKNFTMPAPSVPAPVSPQTH